MELPDSEGAVVEASALSISSGSVSGVGSESDPASGLRGGPDHYQNEGYSVAGDGRASIHPRVPVASSSGGWSAEGNAVVAQLSRCE